MFRCWGTWFFTLPIALVIFLGMLIIVTCILDGITNLIKRIRK